MVTQTRVQKPILQNMNRETTTLLLGGMRTIEMWLLPIPQRTSCLMLMVFANMVEAPFHLKKIVSMVVGMMAILPLHY